MTFENHIKLRLVKASNIGENDGYAVPKRYQKQGRAKEIVAAAIKEFTFGMKRREPEFYIEAIIDAQNKASLRVAEQFISESPKEVTDKIAGVPALQYVKHIK